MFKNRLIDLLKIDYPIIQAPMAGSDSAELVAACSNAGILGSLGAQYLTPSEIEASIKRIRTLTDKPFAMNLFALGKLQAPSFESIEKAIARLKPYYDKFEVSPPTVDEVLNQIDPDEQLQVILDAKVPVFSFTLGMLSAYWMEAFKRNGTILIGTATNIKEAIALDKAGVHAICAQGAEAGGHRGTFIDDYRKSMIELKSLIPHLVDVVSVPVIAAGGIMNGSGIASALSLGASGVQMGTAFLTVEESAIHPNYKDAVCNNDPDSTTITLAFSGGAARGIDNLYIRENLNAELLPFPYHNALTKPFRKIANQRGEIDYTNLWCGQSGKLARKIRVKELVAELIVETTLEIN